MNVAVAFGHWDYWQNYHKITVNYLDRTITVNEGVTELSIKNDVYSDLKEVWLLNATHYDYTKYKLPIRVIGGDPTVEGKFAGDIYFLRNNWVLIYDPRTVKVTGALYSDDFDTPYRFRETDGSLSKIYSNEVSNLVQSISPDNATITSIAESVAENISVDVDFTEVLTEIDNLPTSVEISDAVWNKLLADMLVADSAGDRLKKLLDVNKFLGLS